MATFPNEWKKPIYANDLNIFQYKNNPPKQQKEENKRKSQEVPIENKKAQWEEGKALFMNNHSHSGVGTNQVSSRDLMKKPQIEISVDFIEHISESDEKIIGAHMVNNQPYDKDNNVNNKNNKHNNFPVDHNRDIDAFSNYFNHCLENPNGNGNSYFHYKLFDLNSEEVSKLAYKNSNKIQLFYDEEGCHEIDSGDLVHNKEASPHKIINHRPHFKQSKSLKKNKKDKSNGENSKGLYKPY